MDTEKTRSRLDLMKDQSPNTRYICNDVKLRELNDIVPRKGVLGEGTRRSKKMTVYKYIYSHFNGRGVYWHKNQKLQITPSEIRIREEGFSRY